MNSPWKQIIYNVVSGVIVIALFQTTTVTVITSAVVFLLGAFFYLKSLNKSSGIFITKKRTFETNQNFKLLYQKIFIELASNGDLLHYITTTRIKNMSSRATIAKFNHALRVDEPSISCIEIHAFDNQGLLPTPEIMQSSPQLIDFYIHFREALRSKGKYEYSWEVKNIANVFAPDDPPCLWEYSPSGPVKEFVFEVKHPKKFSVSQIQAIVAATGEEISAGLQKRMEAGHEVTTLILKKLTGGVIDFKWSY